MLYYFDKTYALFKPNNHNTSDFVRFTSPSDYCAFIVKMESQSTHTKYTAYMSDGGLYTFIVVLHKHVTPPS